MKEFKAMISFMGLMFIIMCLIFVGLVYDTIYIEPLAASAANNHCKQIGFDQYKSFTRIGIFSKDPVGIKCEYAERYTDLGVRSNVAI
jgi:hypothetical protein|tara:strand:+ start:1964 stop:2227 length:264 start_codon:yes stop_codon:yes gene_type:complete